MSGLFVLLIIVAIFVYVTWNGGIWLHKQKVKSDMRVAIRKAKLEDQLLAEVIDEEERRDQHRAMRDMRRAANRVPGAEAPWVRYLD